MQHCNLPYSCILQVSCTTLLQATSGARDQGRPLAAVDVRWGDAVQLLPMMPGRIEVLFLDGQPKEYLAYLRAAEPLLAPGCLVIADNVQIFAKSLAEYLDHVRNSGRYESRLVQSTLEWRPDVQDALEVSTFIG